MKTNHDGTIILNAYDTWTACNTCGQRVRGDSIHTCSPQLKTLTDDEIAKLADDILGYQIYGYKESGVYEFARAILRKAQEK